MHADIQGLHHVTAITDRAPTTHAFHGAGLGRRFVKRTVNFDDPSAWHLYYGDRTGAAGGVMTFFAWENIRAGRPGAGQTTLTEYAVPHGALPFWSARLTGLGARLVRREAPFGAPRTVWEAPDGLRVALVEAEDPRTPWTTSEVGPDVAVRGFRGVTLTLRRAGETEAILRDVFGYAPAGEEAAPDGGRLRRLALPGSASGVVDLHVDPAAAPAVEGAGSVHHVAFSVADRAAQARVRARMLDAGLRVTEAIDRDYFWAIYARTPGGVLFEVATEEPGFAVDEPVERLGETLRLPRRHEPFRARIEAALAPLVA